MLFTSLLLAAVLAAKASATIFYAGVAESGGEFGVWSANSVKGTGLPGTFGVEYKFINTAGIDVYVDTHHVNLFRIAFLLERMCPLATGLGATFSETYFSEFKAAVDYVTITKGAYCILDPHNYMRYNDPSSQPMSGSIIGDTSDVTAATQAQFAAFWGALAARFVNNEKVIFGLMNEPHDMDTNLVLSLDQAAITAIRATGAKQMILAPGNGWTGGHSWTQAWTGNSPASGTVMQMISDPLNNTAFDIHQYLDTDSSGGHSVCTTYASDTLAPLTSWLQQYGFKAMITEFGASNGTQCAPYIADIVNYMANNDVYIGWTAWAAGPLWGSWSACCSDSQTWGSLEPGSLASDGSPGMYNGVWVNEIQPLLPTGLQRSGLSNIRGPAGVSSSSSSVRSSTTSRSSSSTRMVTSTTKTSSSSSSTKASSSSSSTKASSSSSSTKASSSSTKASSSSTKTSSSATPSSTLPPATQWQQCGGWPGVFNGPYTCVAPFVCTYSSPYYSQCL